MQYIFLIYGAESRWTEEERAACIVDSLAICERLSAQGKLRGSAPLEPVSTAVTVRVRAGQTLMTDGPFAETAEQLGGFYLLDLADLDEAIAIAASLPPASRGAVEIRPLFPLDGLPESQPLSHRAQGRLDLILYYDDPTTLRNEEAVRGGMREATALAHELERAGRYISASPLRPVETATCVRVRDGKRLITDGPFAETREVLGGYYLVHSDSADDALKIASRHPGARNGCVEVRPLFDIRTLEKSRQNPAKDVDSAEPRTTH
ncbi:MAG: YciI family protein [Isosphaeraceae bacterium]